MVNIGGCTIFEKINEEFLARKEGVTSQHSYQVITGNVTWPNAFRRDVIQYLVKKIRQIKGH